MVISRRSSPPRVHLTRNNVSPPLLNDRPTPNPLLLSDPKPRPIESHQPATYFHEQSSSLSPTPPCRRNRQWPSHDPIFKLVHAPSFSLPSDQAASLHSLQTRSQPRVSRLWALISNKATRRLKRQSAQYFQGARETSAGNGVFETTMPGNKLKREYRPIRG